MKTIDAIRSVEPTEIAPARALAHRAVQHITGFARANIAVQPDDSHSSLKWDASRRAMVSQPAERTFAGLGITSLEVFFEDEQGHRDTLLIDGVSVSRVAEWFDEKARKRGLRPASSARIPYDFPEEVAALEVYEAKGLEASLAALSGWFDLASSALETTRNALQDRTPGPSPVRLWPHHFDIATYVALEEGDPETARGIGIGMAPGDSAYDQPYFYINPWPHLSSQDLPEAAKPGHWHTDGFVGLIATADELLGAADIASALEGFLEEGVSIALGAQGLI